MTLEERVKHLEKEFIRLTHHLNAVTEACKENTEWRKDILEASIAFDEEITFTPDESLSRNKNKDH